ncbi:hypothetical protein [Haloarcula halophila]|uniref:hypothetical protein n=1 Tax=Haloarcula TaxID=2237 RepID=UPI0023E390D3|nr:hypothetical protein [Halomicroarcula sp. DFY41]
MDIDPGTVVPTFKDNKDRLVFLAAEYKIPLSIMALAAGVWAFAVSPDLPTPTERQLTFATLWGVLALPTYWAQKQIAEYLYSPDWVYVGICDPGEEEIYHVEKVPPELWERKQVHGANPLVPDDGICDYVVVRYNYYEEIDELEVRGVAKEDMSPAEATRYEARVDEYYTHHHEVRRAYSSLKATVQRFTTQVHDDTLMRLVEEQEESQLVPGSSALELVEEIEEEIGDMPNGPEGEPPEPEPVLDEQLGDLDITETELTPENQAPELNDD